MLPTVEIAMNTALNESIGQSPHEAERGEAYRLPTSISLPRPPSTTSGPLTLYFERIQEIKDRISDAQERQKKQADTRRQDESFESGDWVLLSTNHLHGLRRSKLSPKRLGPYEVSLKLPGDVYELRLPRGLKIHPRFHVSRLTRFHGQPPSEPPPLHVMEKILGERGSLTGPQWLVQWQGLTEDQSTWEFWSAIHGADAAELIRDFRRDCNTRAGRTPFYTEDQVLGKDLEILDPGGV